MSARSAGWLALAFGILGSAGTAHAGLVPIISLPGGDYYVSYAETAEQGASNSGVPNNYNKGGLCPTTSFPTGCHTPTAAGPALVNGLIPIDPTALSDGDTDYELIITVSDLTSPDTTPYEVTFGTAYLGTTPAGGGSFTVTLSDGASPHTYGLGITSEYIANTLSPSPNADQFVVSFSELDLPEPASTAIFACGAGLLGLLRRYRAGR